MTDQVTLEGLDFGTRVFDEEGRELGRIRGFDEDGFYVTFREGAEGLSSEHVTSGGAFGEAELTWRCRNCGEVGTIGEDLPETCPGCGRPKEELYYRTED